MRTPAARRLALAAAAGVAAAALFVPGRGRSVSAAEAPRALAFRIAEGATLDLGWTGIAHGQAWPADQHLVLGLRCAGAAEPCAVAGGRPGDHFGAPLPLAAGGVPACVVSRLRAPAAGTLTPATGCGALELRLTARVFLGQAVDQPCPVCRGDRNANDGARDGRCAGGASDGAPCDGQGASPFGTTSQDCLPPGTGVGDLAIDLAPLTTGIARLTAGEPCATRLPGPELRCPCAGQTSANACTTGRCGADGRCEGGPLDGVCSGAALRECVPGVEPDPCVAAGAGVCTPRPRRCVGEALSAEGHCDPRTPVYVAVFCAGATRAPAINATAGLPGPARAVLPLVILPPATRAKASPSPAPAR